MLNFLSPSTLLTKHGIHAAFLFVRELIGCTHLS